MENQKQTTKSMTLPILFVLSLVLNYGQFSGWVKIQNPSEQNKEVKAIKEAAYTIGQRDSLALKITDLGE